MRLSSFRRIDYPPNEKEITMKLNIYKGREVVKTYTADTYDLMFGTVEDIAEAIKMDDMKIGDDREIMKMALGLITRSMDTVKDLLKDIFDGITDDEIKHTKLKEIGAVLVECVQYTIVEMSRGLDRKNR